LNPGARLATLTPIHSTFAMSTTLHPLRDSVVVRPVRETKTAAGIELPDTVERGKTDRGDVIATGPGKFEDGAVVPMVVQVGDRVLFAKFAADEIEVDGETLMVISEADVKAVITTA